MAANGRFFPRQSPHPAQLKLADFVVLDVDLMNASDKAIRKAQRTLNKLKKKGSSKEIEEQLQQQYLLRLQLE